MKTHWILPEPPDGLQPPRLSCLKQTFPALTSHILRRQGLLLPEQIKNFLNPKLKSLSDPFLLPDMRRAVERLDAALRRREQIVIFGDYDVDGVASTAIIARLLIAYGGKVACFLPNRAEEGYGLSKAAIQRCLSQANPSLLIAVDCATNALEGAAFLRQAGVDLIILDHHEFAGTRPDCKALVNPKLGEDFHYLCSAGIAFKLAHAMLKHSRLPNFDIRHFLDLVALATLADLAPLIAENRILVRKGLLQMQNTRWPGLAALIHLAGMNSPIRSSDVSFRLGPRINAAGRLGEADAALQLLLTNDPLEATRLAQCLDAQNRERQNLERLVTEEVEAWITRNFDPARQPAIVAGQEDWHDGVLGIVASRVMRRYHRPTLVVGFHPDGTGKGSARSIQGLSLVEALTRCSRYLSQFGGHEMAAGLVLERRNFEAFRSAFQEVAGSMLKGRQLHRTLTVDLEVSLQEVDFPLLEEQEMLEPFGIGNEQPLLIVRSVTPTSEPRIIRERHIRFEFVHHRRRINAIFFDGALDPLPQPPWDIVFRLERNEYLGRSEPQMQVVAIRHTSPNGHT